MQRFHDVVCLLYLLSICEYYVKATNKVELVEVFSNSQFSNRVLIPECLYKWRFKNKNTTNGLHNQHTCNNPTGYYFDRSSDHLTWHFPHFAQHYFLYISKMLASSLGNCTTYCVISESSRLAIAKSKHSSSTWINGILKVMATALNHSSLIIYEKSDLSRFLNYSGTPIRNKDELSFLHPSDAVILTSLVLGRTACPSIYKLINETQPIRFHFFQRTGTRNTLNIKYLVRELEYIHGNTVQPRVFGFDKFSTLFEQAKEFNEVDILFSIHGAGLTNIAFMNPCSVVIEVFPYGMKSQLFGNLANSSDIGYFSWNEKFSNSIFNPNIHEKCVRVLRDIGKVLSLKMDRIISDKLTIEQTDNLTLACTDDVACRRCYRDVDKVRVSPDKFNYAAMEAMQYHRNCKKFHPYYTTIEEV